MRGSDTLFSSKSDEYSTPYDTFNALDYEFHFTLDACATESNRKCKKYYSVDTDGLKADWGGRKSVL